MSLFQHKINMTKIINEMSLSVEFYGLNTNKLKNQHSCLNSIVLSVYWSASLGNKIAIHERI